jgi:hypothetical protein
MTERIIVPVTVMKNGDKWGDLSVLGATKTHEVCGTTVNPGNDYSYKGGHRVRLYKFKGQVAFRIPAGLDLDISGVAPQSRSGASKGGDAMERTQ